VVGGQGNHGLRHARTLPCRGMNPRESGAGPLRLPPGFAGASDGPEIPERALARFAGQSLS
jgi:hypothetical protein